MKPIKPLAWRQRAFRAQIKARRLARIAAYDRVRELLAQVPVVNNTFTVGDIATAEQVRDAVAASRRRGAPS